MDCFLIDENVIHEISKGSKEGKICFEFLYLMIKRCDKILLNYRFLWGRYLKIINKYDTHYAYLLVRQLIYASHSNEKCIRQERLDKKLPEEFREKLRGEKEEEPDLPLIDLALSTKCKFLTTDQRLIKKYQQIGVPSEFQIIFLKCREALALLGQSYNNSPIQH